MDGLKKTKKIPKTISVPAVIYSSVTDTNFEIIIIIGKKVKKKGKAIPATDRRGSHII
jgi:hypothetical protein